MNYSKCMFCGAPTGGFYVCEKHEDHELQPAQHELLEEDNNEQTWE